MPKKIKTMNLQEVKIKLESLDVKNNQEDYEEYKKIVKEVYYFYKKDVAKGRCEATNIIRGFEHSLFGNSYPRQGYESFPRLEYYKNFVPKNHKEEQFMYDDLHLELRRYRLFGKYSTLKNR